MESRQEPKANGTVKKDEDEASKCFDRTLNAVGAGGKYQWKIFLIASFCGVFTGLQSLSAAFLAAVPNYRCNDPSFNNVSESSLKTLLLNNSVFRDDQPKCDYFIFNNSDEDINKTIHETLSNSIECSTWVYDDSIYTSTVVTEWDLVCKREWLVPVIQSSFMIGVLIGAVVLSELSDMYGRRTISVLSVVGMFITSVASSFSFNLIMFLVLKFLVAFFVSGVFLPNFVLIMEIVGTKGRTTMGVLYQFFFAVGFALLPGIAFFIRDWRMLQLTISVPSIVLLSYIWILPESPRWLMLQGRTEEALNILRTMAEVNGGQLPPNIELEKLVVNIQKNREFSRSILGRIAQFFKSQVILLRTPIMRRRCLIIFFGWFIVSMVYFGLAFSGGNINASVYLMVFLGGAVELPSLIFATWTVQKFGRRMNLTSCFFICGIACIMILFVPKGMVWLNLTLASVGKFFDSIAFSIVYIYSAELVPTEVRNIAVGTSSMCARLGSTIAPFIVESLGKYHYAIPSTVFGLLSLVAGTLILFLPETGQMPLPETVHEVEAMKK